MIEALVLFVALFAVLFSGLTLGALRASGQEDRQIEIPVRTAPRR